MNMNYFPNNTVRILVIDDNKAIHEDIQKVLGGGSENNEYDDTCKDLEADIFGGKDEIIETQYVIDSAYQGMEGYELVIKAKEEGNPYIMAFVDMRMPPGWDGCETIQKIWEVDEEIEIVICTAYADQSWSELIAALKHSDKYIIIKKPFDVIEIKQITRAITTKWAMHQELQRKFDNLELEVQARIKNMSQMEVELRHAQKLEAVGQLAAGVAHEINTPIQFVGDSVQFLNSAFEDLEKLIDVYRKSYVAQNKNNDDEVQQTEKNVDLEYLTEEVPKAFGDTIEGITRVAKIVGAMKQFAHPASEMASADINEALRTTLTVASSEYKYIANLESNFEDELPKVTCMLGDLNQVFLNLIVNAAHAIADSDNKQDGKGLITVNTKQEGEYVIISIRDNGNGIPQDVQARVFDPFFTTKEVGKGTGQGLSIAHNIIKDKHGGELYFETEEGVGTTFFIKLLIDGPNTSAQCDLEKVS